MVFLGRFGLPDTRITAALQPGRPAIDMKTTVATAIEACCSSVQRDVGPSESALVMLQATLPFTLPLIVSWYNKITALIQHIRHFAASQIHRLLSNWYVTAGDIAAMSEVQYMFSASPAYVHMSLASLCSSTVIVCIDGMREYS